MPLFRLIALRLFSITSHPANLERIWNLVAIPSSRRRQLSKSERIEILQAKQNVLDDQGKEMDVSNAEALKRLQHFHFLKFQIAQSVREKNMPISNRDHSIDSDEDDLVMSYQNTPIATEKGIDADTSNIEGAFLHLYLEFTTDANNEDFSLQKLQGWTNFWRRRI